MEDTGLGFCARKALFWRGFRGAKISLVWGLTLFGSGCYSRSVPLDAGYLFGTSDRWNCPSSSARTDSLQPTTHASSLRDSPASVKYTGEAITLFDDNNAHNSDSATSVIEHAEPAEGSIHETAAPESQVADAQDEKQPAATEDFASALENFTTESEEAASDDNVIKGTVLKLTATHVVVDIGAKSEGMLPLSEVLDHEGKPRFKPGDEIDVMREKGQTEEGYINLSHQKAQRLRAWDEIEKAHNEKGPSRRL